MHYNILETTASDLNLGSIIYYLINLDKLLSLPITQCPHLHKRNANSTYLIRLLSGLHGLMYVILLEQALLSITEMFAIVIPLMLLSISRSVVKLLPSLAVVTLSSWLISYLSGRSFSDSFPDSSNSASPSNWHSSCPALHHLLFSLKYFPTVLSPTPDDAHLPLKSILPHQISPKSRTVCITRLMSKTKLDIFLLSLTSPPVYHISKYRYHPSTLLSQLETCMSFITLLSPFSLQPVTKIF